MVPLDSEQKKSQCLFTYNLFVKTKPIVAFTKESLYMVPSYQKKSKPYQEKYVKTIILYNNTVIAFSDASTFSWPTFCCAPCAYSSS